MHWGTLFGVGGVAAVTAVAVTGDEVRRYPLPQSVAVQRLQAAPLPDALAGIGGGAERIVRDGNSLVWRLGDEDTRSTGTVTLTGDGASTDVTIRFALSDKALGGSPIAATALTRSMAESMFIEHVDAVLGGRPFNAQRMMDSTAAELIANPKMLEEYGASLRQQFIAVSEQMNQLDDATRADVPDPRSATRVDPATYRPMTDLSSKA